MPGTVGIAVEDEVIEHGAVNGETVDVAEHPVSPDCPDGYSQNVVFIVYGQMIYHVQTERGNGGTICVEI